MKYVLFTIALLGTFPGAFLCMMDKRMMRLSIMGVIVPVIVYSQTSLNFYSEELYRGTSRGMEVSMVCLFAFCIMMACTLRKGRILSPLPNMNTWLFMLYYLLMLPSLSTAENKMYSFFELWKMSMLLLLFLAVYYYLEETGNIDFILMAFAIVVVANFLTVVKQHVVGTSQAWGLFVHQNCLAMYMNMLGSIFYARYLNRKESIKTWVVLIVFGASVATMLRTYSRGALACFPISFLIITICSFIFEFKIRKALLIMPLLAMTMIGTLLMLPKIIQRFENAPESSANTRIDFAIAAMNMIRQHPWVGQGVNNWGIKINPPYDFAEHRERMRYPEDYKDGIVETIYLLVAAECGIPCLVALLLWYMYNWVLALKLMRRLRATPYFYFPVGMLGGMTAIYIQSCLEWVLKQQVNFMQLVIGFAILSYLNKNWRKLKQEYIDYCEEARLHQREDIFDKVYDVAAHGIKGFR